jgi:hypothetical protein
LIVGFGVRFSCLRWIRDMRFEFGEEKKRTEREERVVCIAVRIDGICTRLSIHESASIVITSYLYFTLRSPRLPESG